MTSKPQFITMKWTREKAKFILRGDLSQTALDTMTDDELFEIGIDYGYWSRMPE